MKTIEWIPNFHIPTRINFTLDNLTMPLWCFFGHLLPACGTANFSVMAPIYFDETWWYPNFGLCFEDWEPMHYFAWIKNDVPDYIKMLLKNPRFASRWERSATQEFTFIPRRSQI